MKPFNLKEAKAGKPVCTRDGKPVRIICFDALSEYPIVGLITDDDSEHVATFTKDGCILDATKDREDDLMMADVKKEGYIALIDNCNYEDTCIMGTTNVYPSEEECYKRFSKVKGYVKTIKIEWEE